MKRSHAVSILVLLLLSGCDQWNQQNDTPADSGTGTDTESQKADTDSEMGTDSESAAPTTPPTDILKTPLPHPVSKFEELAIALENRRIEIEQQERDLISREQILSGIEADLINKQDRLQQLKNDLKRAQDAAIANIDRATQKKKASIASTYQAAHKDIEDRWKKVQQDQKVFIETFLEDENELSREVHRLQTERSNRVKLLITTIEGMKPHSSAQMLTSMTPDDAIAVMRGVNPEMSAAIFASMPPAAAAKLVEGILGPRIDDVANASDIPLPDPPPDMEQPDEVPQ